MCLCAHVFLSTILFAIATLGPRRITAEKGSDGTGIGERGPHVQVTTGRKGSEGGESGAVAYLGREELYKDIVETIRRVADSQRGQKVLLLTGLHGDSGPRRTALLHDNPTLASFDNEMRTCVNSRGPDMWYVRELYNIADPDRLQMILDRIQASYRERRVRSSRIRAFRILFPQFKPLVVGREDLFLGVDDPTYYRVKAGMHIRGSGFVSLATAHFDELWNAQLPRLFKLRSATGEDSAEIGLLCKTISMSRVQESDPQRSRQSASRTDFLRSGIWAVLGKESATIQTILHDLDIHDRTDREELMRLLGVLVEEGRIEADGSKPSGYYRLRRTRG